MVGRARTHTDTRALCLPSPSRPWCHRRKRGWRENSISVTCVRVGAAVCLSLTANPLTHFKDIKKKKTLLSVVEQQLLTPYI